MYLWKRTDAIAVRRKPKLEILSGNFQTSARRALYNMHVSVASPNSEDIGTRAIELDVMSRAQYLG